MSSTGSRHFFKFSQGGRNVFATPRSSTWIVLNFSLFVILLYQHWSLDKGLSRDFKGHFVFEFWVLRFQDLGTSSSRFGCFGCFVLRSSFSSALFSKLPRQRIHFSCNKKAFRWQNKYCTKKFCVNSRKLTREFYVRFVFGIIVTTCI